MNVILIDRYPPQGQALSALLTLERPMLRFSGQAYTAESGMRLAASLSPELILLEPLLFGHVPRTQQARIGELKAACPNSQLIFTSTSNDPAHIQTALRLEAADYLLKPTQSGELLAALDRCAGVRPAGDAARVQEEGAAQQTFAALIHQGNGEAALELLRREFQAGSGLSYFDQCIHCMELATQVIHLPEEVNHVPEELITLYQELIRYISRHNSLEVLTGAMEHFTVQSAGIFNRFSRDQGYHQTQAAKRFVEEHLGEPLTLERVAAELYISTTYFSRLFKSKTGQTFSDYLAERRIEQAKILLIGSSTSVAEIARQVGYSEPNSFTRLFKAHTGMSPSQYRNQEAGGGPGRETGLFFK